MKKFSKVAWQLGSLVFLVLIFVYSTPSRPAAGVPDFLVAPSARSAFEGQHPLGLRFKNAGEGTNDYIRTQMKICFEAGGMDHCYKDAAEIFLAQFKFQEVLSSLQETETHEEVFSRCHELTHYLGRTAYETNKNIPALYGEGSPVCHGGFYHGVIEAHFRAKNLPLFNSPDSLIVREIQNVCGKPESYATPRFYSECLHGIGHAMMFITNADLPRSLKFCDALESQGDRETCYGGVFMENSSSSTSEDHPSAYLRSNDPMYPCTILDEKYLKICYQYQSSYFAELTKWNWQETINLCFKVPQEYQDGCFNVVGTNQVGYSQDLEAHYQTCNLIKEPRFKTRCIDGVMSSFGGRYVGDPSYMFAFCKLVDRESKKGCYLVLGEEVTSWSRDSGAKDKICEQIPEKEYIEVCKNGR